jgi:hypothetical protein
MMNDNSNSHDGLHKINDSKSGKFKFNSNSLHSLGRQAGNSLSTSLVNLACGRASAVVKKPRKEDTHIQIHEKDANEASSTTDSDALPIPQVILTRPSLAIASKFMDSGEEDYSNSDKEQQETGNTTISMPSSEEQDEFKSEISFPVIQKVQIQGDHPPRDSTATNNNAVDRNRSILKREPSKVTKIHNRIAMTLSKENLATRETNKSMSMSSRSSVRLLK